LSHIVLFDRVFSINLLWFETNESIVSNWNVELLTELSLIDNFFVIFILQEVLGEINFLDLWLRQDGNVLIETVLFGLNNDETCYLFDGGGNVIFTVPV
jgi:hypothetical protein